MSDSTYGFKKDFILANLSRVIDNKSRVVNNCDSNKKWLITVWFGSILLYYKEPKLQLDIAMLLMLEVLAFYLLETIFRILEEKQAWRIYQMEKWVMTATKEKIMGLEGPLAEITNHPSLKDTISFIVGAFRNYDSFPFYVVMAFFGYVIVNILPNNAI